MSVDPAEEYRKKAEECREQVEKSMTPTDKSAWLRIAGQWLKLAQETDVSRLRHGLRNTGLAYRLHAKFIYSYVEMSRPV
jgi:GH15 family glucan-1,4-alpha-glucosidase